MLLLVIAPIAAFNLCVFHWSDGKNAQKEQTVANDKQKDKLEPKDFDLGQGSHPVMHRGADDVHQEDIYLWKSEIENTSCYVKDWQSVIGER